MSLAKAKYCSQRGLSRRRGIEFNLSFDQWYQWWLDQGVDKNIKNPNQSANDLTMGRKGDAGGYTLDNIECVTRSKNSKDAWSNKRYKVFQPIKTPLGIFDSIKDALAAHKWKHSANLWYYMKKQPTQYFRIGEKHNGSR
jgi:hypothetical protein